MKRRNFLKMIGAAVTAPIALAKSSPEAKGKTTLDFEPETGVKKDDVVGQPSGGDIQGTLSYDHNGFERTYIRNKIYAVPKSEKIYLDYYGLKQTTQKPLLRILGWENNLKYVFLPLDEIKCSDKPLPRHYVEFESEQPLEMGDLIELFVNWRPVWDNVGDKEYIVVEVQPVSETFEYGQVET